MTFDKNTKEITVNRGDKFTIKINNNLGTFKIGYKIKFSLEENGD